MLLGISPEPILCVGHDKGLKRQLPARKRLAQCGVEEPRWSSEGGPGGGGASRLQSNSSDLRRKCPKELDPFWAGFNRRRGPQRLGRVQVDVTFCITPFGHS